MTNESREGFEAWGISEGLQAKTDDRGMNYPLGDHLRLAWEAALQWAASQQAAEGWQPIETAPEEGVFLVYLPQEREAARIQVARWRKNVKIIGSVFSFDTTAPTLWQPLPAAPTAQGERDV